MYVLPRCTSAEAHTADQAPSSFPSLNTSVTSTAMPTNPINLEVFRVNVIYYYELPHSLTAATLHLSRWRLLHKLHVLRLHWWATKIQYVDQYSSHSRPAIYVFQSTSSSGVRV